MATNKVSRGNVWNIPAPVGGVVSGRPIQQGGRPDGTVLIPLETANEGEMVACAAAGMWNLNKTTGPTQAMEIGQLANMAFSLVTNDTTLANLNCFRVAEKAATGDEFVKVMLVQKPTP